MKNHNVSKGCNKPQETHKKLFISNQTFEKRIEEVLFKQNHNKDIKVDIKKGIFFDNCSTMELFYYSDLVDNTTKAVNKITVQVNSGTLAVNHNAKVTIYKIDVWFSKYAITNIISLQTLIKQY